MVPILKAVAGLESLGKITISQLSGYLSCEITGADATKPTLGEEVHTCYSWKESPTLIVCKMHSVRIADPGSYKEVEWDLAKEPGCFQRIWKMWNLLLHTHHSTDYLECVLGMIIQLSRVLAVSRCWSIRPTPAGIITPPEYHHNPAR
jgi:hypothetical protein